MGVMLERVEARLGEGATHRRFREGEQMQCRVRGDPGSSGSLLLPGVKLGWPFGPPQGPGPYFLSSVEGVQGPLPPLFCFQHFRAVFKSKEGTQNPAADQLLWSLHRTTQSPTRGWGRCHLQFWRGVWPQDGSSCPLASSLPASPFSSPQHWGFDSAGSLPGLFCMTPSQALGGWACSSLPLEVVHWLSFSLPRALYPGLPIGAR